MKLTTKNWKLAGALAAVGMAAGMALSTGASAAGTVSLTVSATIQGICKVTAGSPGTIALGTIDPSGIANVTGTANYTMKCTNGVASLAWDIAGAGIGASMARSMSDGGTNSLSYTLSAAGDTGFTGAGFSAAATAQTVTLTATVTPAQFADAAAAVYSETVTINVNP